MAQTYIFSKKNLGFIVTFLTLFSFIGCESPKKETVQTVAPTPLPTEGEILLPSGKKLKTYLALSLEQQTQGLSGVKASDFSDHEAMLFFYTEDSIKSFWMPDTYFDLDIYFLSKDLEVLDVERNVPHHPGRSEDKKPIARTRPIYCRHVFEVKSSSPLAKEIQKGTKLIWNSNPSLLQIESNIRPTL
ncbi:MAG: DUF192 domain-containing protein [Bacteriovoracaceae bacterium]|nr:DUF192 domain-containing protein [Bacteriovoracaceae bacterium]